MALLVLRRGARLKLRWKRTLRLLRRLTISGGWQAEQPSPVCIA